MPSTFYPWKNEKTHLQQPKTLKHPPLCKECKLNLSKYTCPGCSVRSCSLPCAKAYKQQTGCTGKRQRTQFVPLFQFDDNLLLSVKRVAESAQRTRVNLCGYSHFKIPSHPQGLVMLHRVTRRKSYFSPVACRRGRKINLNTTKDKCITWTIQWHFDSIDIVLLNRRVNENSILSSVIENHLKPRPWNHKLKLFCAEQLDCLKFFIRKYLKGPRSLFHEFDIKAPIRQQLVNLVILEEEEIEEHGGSSNPQFLDLMKHVKSTEANKLWSSPHEKEPGENMDFDYDFDQGLLDVYFDTIAQINPDDFLE
ncbi:hypothetical protein PVL29_019448 [Vitis rotundifolia]|uniref:HIT-type domain-containing protein n=1 Tax=Vitis rotundifolia TaxID=103349 RepID=A0AA38Z0K2_VITRO|nr:hypothetical protein PVL29_019448 [Vitis rotundifolia]